MTLLPVLALVKTYAFTYKKPLRVCLSTLPDRMSERLRFYSPCNRGLLRAMDSQLASCQLSCAPVGQHGACVGSRRLHRSWSHLSLPKATYPQVRQTSERCIPTTEGR